MKKAIEVVPYNSEWPQTFAAEAALIHAALGENGVAVHHIGSTSVPGLPAKPRIDICVAVQNRKAAIPPLEALGYAFRGELNIPFRFYFTKQDPPVNLHMYDAGSDEIALHLAFRNYLRSHDDIRDAYAALKATLLAEKDAQERSQYRLPKYTLGKNDMILRILALSGFDGTTLRHPIHETEWRDISTLLGYAAQHTEQDLYFILYRGIKAQAAAHVVLEAPGHMTIVSCGGPEDGQTVLRERIQKWALEQEDCLSESPL